MAPFQPSPHIKQCLDMQHKVVLAVSLKLPTETKSRVMHLVLPFSSLMRGHTVATSDNADALFAYNIWKEVEANISVDSAFNELLSIGLLEAYVGTMVSAHDTAVISGDACVYKFSELRYSITTAISGTKFKAIGRNLYNSVASVVSAEYKDRGTRCNRILINDESMPVFQFALNANLEGTAHGEHILSNRSSSAAEIEKFVANMKHARPTFDHGKIKDAPTGGVTIVEREDLTQVEKISFIRSAAGADGDDDSAISSVSLGLSVQDTKNNLRMTDVLGPYMARSVGFAARRSSNKRASSKLPPFSGGNVQNSTPAVLDVPPGHPKKHYTLLRRNIPNVDSVLTNDFINSGQQVQGLEYLYTQKDVTPADRWTELLSIPRRKIEASHKRNTVKVEHPIPKEGFLEWCAQFAKREAEKGIYVPPFPVLSMHNVMGVEWLTGSVPDSLYERFSEMKTALQVDLEFHLSKNPMQQQLVRKQQCGYRAFHTLVLSLYTGLYLHKTPDYKLLHCDLRSTSLAIFIDRMIEFFHQQSVCGVDMDHYREFCLFIGQLPAKYQYHLNEAMRTLMNSIFTSVGIRFDSAAASSGVPSIRSVSTELSASTSTPQLHINPIQRKQFPCFLCQESHKFLRCPHIEVKLRNEKYRSQFDKVYPPSSPQVAAITTGDEVLPSPSIEDDTQQESHTAVASGFDDDVIDNSRSLFAISSELYNDDTSCYSDDGEVLLQLYPVQRYPVCTHCRSFEHPTHLCPVVSVDVADVTDGYEHVSFTGDDICINAVDQLSSGEDGISLRDNALSDNSDVPSNTVVSIGNVVSSLHDVTLAGEDTADTDDVSDGIALAGEDTATTSNVSLSTDNVPAVPQNQDEFHSSGFPVLDLIHDLERDHGFQLNSFSTPMDPTYSSGSDSTCFCNDYEASLFCQILRVLQTVADGGRFDIQAAVSDLSHYMRHPQRGHFQALQRVLGYLKSNTFGCNWSNRSFHTNVCSAVAEAQRNEVRQLDTMAVFMDSSLQGIIPDADDAGFIYNALDEDEDEIRAATPIGDPPYRELSQINAVSVSVTVPSSGSLVFPKFTPELRELLQVLASHGLDDTGADDNTTHDQSIIHDLRLLPEDQWTKFKDAGKHPHVSKYGGYSLVQLDHPPGSFKRIPMRYTPSLPITVVNFTKFRDPLKRIESEFTSYFHSLRQFIRVWKYTDGSFEICSLFKLQILNPSIERYYTPEFVRVSSETLQRYKRGEYATDSDFKHVFSVDSILGYTNDSSTQLLQDPSAIHNIARNTSTSPSAVPTSDTDSATVSTTTGNSSTARSRSVTFAPGTKSPVASPSDSLTALGLPYASRPAKDVIEVLRTSGGFSKDLDAIVPSAPPVLKPPASRYNNEVTTQLWHHRLCHMGNAQLSNLWKYVDGVPRIPRPHPLMSCSSCMGAKIRKNGKPVSQFHLIEAICNDPNGHFFQHVFADRGFIVQKSKNLERYKRLCAYNGDNNYLCIECVWSTYVFLYTSDNKEMPLLWLEWLLSKYAPRDIKEKTFRMDGEGDNDALCKLFQSRGYHLESTGGNNSAANPLPERFNDTLKTNIVATIKGVEWSMKVWNDAAYHLARIYNILPNASGIVAFTRATGRRPDICNLRLFGCPMEALKPGKHDLDDKGRFEAFHSAKFDELFNSVQFCPPVARDLRRALNMEVPTLVDDRRRLSCDIDIDIVTSDKFARVFTITFIPQRVLPHGFSFDIDASNMDRPYVSAVAPKSLGRTHRSWRKDFIGAYVTRVDDKLLYTVADITCAIENAIASESAFSMTFSQDIHDPLPKADLSKALTCIDLDQTRYIRSIIRDIEAGEDAVSVQVAQMSIMTDPSGLATFDDLDDTSAISDFSIPVELYEYNAGELDTSPIDSNGDFLDVNNISKGSDFTRKQLKDRDDFEEWKAAEFEQLDNMQECDMFGNIVTRTSLKEQIKSKSVDVIRPVWAYRIKLHTSKKKARFCGGGQHIKPKSKQEYKTYTACASASGVRLVTAIAALENRLLFTTDAKNAYAQSGPLSKACFLVVDEVFRDWYLDRFKIELAIGMLIEVKSSIQGHYEAGPNWQRKADTAMASIQFHPCPHDPSIYSHQNKDIVVRQIDDFYAAMKTEEEFVSFLNKLKQNMNIDREGDLATDYNGFEVHQFREYIALGVGKYISKLCATLGWEERPRPKNLSTAPLTGDLLKEIDSAAKGPVGSSPEGLALRKEFGFNYRFLLGALVYCGVIVRVDIAYSLGLLSRFAEYPAPVHYKGLKSVLRYLRDTKDWMLIYWRIEPLESLPSGPFQPIDEPDDCDYQYPSDPFLVSADVDSSHANCKLTRRSTGGHNIMLGATVVLWSSKLQQLVALSSTEAEFYQAVTCCKAIIWLRHIMNEIGRPQLAPSPVNEDNIAAIMMINQKRPTSRTRHMEYQWYAIQEWKEQGLVKCHYIPTADNSSDNLTKGLARILHHRHARRAMGHFGSPYSKMFPHLKIRSEDKQKNDE
ncbi:hypothetical protein CTEN210_11927 [Chaetoceros tenuissimus]|uniref:Reverse transcriptase Ty1/copia-type domain-containing protein n=1 Tax=Chaetoceros tenuissimus TaxID=426638 RepID=A0AAD3D091_9STRA|nr:hypothetical protein CTEN210_11927 [Chaetoceros tenuissimus]